MSSDGQFLIQLYDAVHGALCRTDEVYFHKKAILLGSYSRLMRSLERAYSSFRVQIRRGDMFILYLISTLNGE